MATDLELYQRLNTELVSLVDHFSNLVKATREGLDAEDETAAAVRSGDRRVPGELLEVMVEKLLAAGHQCIHTVSQLKKYAMVSDFTALMANVHVVQQQLTSDTHLTTRGLEHIKRDAESLLAELEQHYYSSAHKGQPPRQEQDAQSSKLAELCAQALQMTGG